MLLRVSPRATTCTPEDCGTDTRGSPALAMPLAGDERRRGITKCCPGRTAAALVRLLAERMAATGTPCLREIVSSVSPRATTIGLPPSQVHCGGGGAGGGTEPVMSALPG